MRTLILICIFLGSCFMLHPQELEGRKDYSLFPRFEPFALYDYSEREFEAYRFCDENGDNFVVEGKVLYYYYELDEGEVDPKVILKKYSSIAEENGGMHYGDGEHQLYLIMNDGSLSIYADIYAEDFYYTLNIIERGDLMTDISSDDLIMELKEKGKAVMYFDFRRKECVMTEDCMRIVKMIAEALKEIPELTISIDAHTDNLGRPDHNLELSKKRAELLYATLVKEGIAAERLEHNGYGEENPVADNNTVMGRAFNNRIELVKK